MPRHHGDLLAVLTQTWRRFNTDRIPLIAAGATFFILLSLFPAFASIVSLYGIFADKASIANEIYRASAFLPRGAVITLNAELQRLMAQPTEKAGITFLVTTIIALWSASGGVKAIIEGLDIAYEVRENRSFIKFSAIALLITALGIVAAAISLEIAVLLPLLFAYFPYRHALGNAVAILSWPAALFFGMATLSVVYRYGPNRSRRWRWFSWGAVLAATMWLAGTAAFKIYVRNFGSFDRVYGSLGAAIGFMVWIWLSLVILLLGAELNCEMERRERAAQPSRPGKDA